MKRHPRFSLTSTLALAAALAATFAAAQNNDGAVASLKSVVGSVLVGKDTGLATGSDELRLTRHARVITTSNSEAVVKYDNGCEVRLKPNQRFEVETDKPCEVLLAQVESILTEPVAGTVAQEGLLGAVVPALGAGFTTYLILQSQRQGSAVSPN